MDTTEQNTNTENESTETLIVISKVKKFIKEQQGLNVSQSFIPKVDEDIRQSIMDAVENAKKMGRKTVMGRDFNFYKDEPKIDQVLVVAAKVKKLIKELGDFNTSAQVMEQLTVRVQKICLDAIKNAVDDKRKTVMDRDFIKPTSHL
jgi:histone H3/H4